MLLKSVSEPEENLRTPSHAPTQTKAGISSTDAAPSRNTTAEGHCSLNLLLYISKYLDDNISEENAPKPEMTT